MKKENIFDLYAAQHKDEPAPAADRVPGEVTQEDVPPAREETPEPKQEPAPEPKQETALQDPEPKQEGGNDNGI